MHGCGLAGNQGIRFLLVLPALGVAENDVAHREFLEHDGGDFARVGADLVLAHVLRAQPDVGIDDRFRNLAQRGERRAEDDVHLFHVGQLDLEAAHQFERLRDRLVHLPITSNNQFPFFIHKMVILAPSLLCAFALIHFSLNAATPGRTWPSRNSRLAPPPVLMKVTLSPNLALFNASTRSPPPMMLLAPLFCVKSATARATAKVPSANRLSSNKPIGPFQRMVLALATSAQ